MRYEYEPGTCLRERAHGQSRRLASAVQWSRGASSSRMLCPYSLSTGIAEGGAVEIAGYIHSLRTQGFCCIDEVTFFLK